MWNQIDLIRFIIVNKKIKHLYILNCRRFPHIWKTGNWADVSTVWFVKFLCIGTMLPFIYMIRNTLFLKQSLKISTKGLLIQFSNIFSTRTLILSWLWVLLSWSRREVFRKIDVFRNFTKLTGKHLWQSFFFNKIAGLITPLVAAS